MKSEVRPWCQSGGGGRFLDAQYTHHTRAPLKIQGCAFREPTATVGLTPIRRKEPSVFDNKKFIQNDAIAFTKTAGFVGVFTA